MERNPKKRHRCNKINRQLVATRGASQTKGLIGDAHVGDVVERRYVQKASIIFLITENIASYTITLTIDLNCLMIKTERSRRDMRNDILVVNDAKGGAVEHGVELGSPFLVSNAGSSKGVKSHVKIVNATSIHSEEGSAGSTHAMAGDDDALLRGRKIVVAIN